MTTNFADTQILRKLPKGFMHNLQASNNATTPDTKLDVAAGECRDSTDAIDMALTAATINTANVGALGMDTGVLAASTWYAAYALKDTSNTLDPTFVLSASMSAPAAQTVNGTTYDAYRAVDYWRADASVHFLKGKTVGNDTFRTHYHDTNIAVLTSGTATTLTAIDLSAAVPPIAGMTVLLMVDYTPATAGDTVSFAPFGSTATVLPHVTGSVAAKANSAMIEVPVLLDSGVPKILYINSAGSGDADVWVMGYRYPV